MSAFLVKEMFLDMYLCGDETVKAKAEMALMWAMWNDPNGLLNSNEEKRKLGVWILVTEYKFILNH